jgi:hypothetical protein
MTLVVPAFRNSSAVLRGSLTLLAAISVLLLGLLNPAPAAAASDPDTRDPSFVFTSTLDASGPWQYSQTQLAQPFIATASRNLSRVEMFVAPAAGAFRGLSVHLADAQGAPAPDPVPGGVATTVDVVASSPGVNRVVASFDSFPELTSGQMYAIVIDNRDGNGDPVAIGYQFTAPTPESTMRQENNGLWPRMFTGALFFEIWTTRFATPTAPTALTAACGVVPAVQTPALDGVVYAERTRTSDAVVVAASAATGYRFTAGATSEWTFSALPCAGSGSTGSGTASENSSDLAESGIAMPVVLLAVAFGFVGSGVILLMMLQRQRTGAVRRSL